MSDQTGYSNKGRSDLSSFFEKLFDVLSNGKLVAPLVVLILLLGVFFTVQQIQRQQETRSRAAGFPGGVTLKFVPVGSTTISPGGTVQVDVKMDIPSSFTDGISGVQFQVRGENTNLTVTSITESTTNPFTQGLLPNGAKVRMNGSIAEMNVGNDQGISGSDISLARLTLQAGTTTGTTNLIFITEQDKSLVSAFGDSYRGINVLGPANTLPFTIGSSGRNNAVNLQLNAQTASVARGTITRVNVSVVMDNPDSLPVTGAEIHITYPTNALTYRSVTNGTLLPASLINPTVQSGTIVLSPINGASTTSNPVTGSGTIATIAFDTIAGFTGSTAQIAFNQTNTVVTVLGERNENKLGTTTPTTITFNTTSPTSTPTRVPPTSTPTNVPPTATPVPPTATPIVPTATPTLIPNHTYLQVSVKLSAIGINDPVKDPLDRHTIRQASVVMEDANNNKYQRNGTLTWDGNNLFTGIIDMGTNVPSGVYQIKVKVDKTLYKRYDRIFNITSSITTNQVNVLPTLQLVSGDMIADTQNNRSVNEIDILDYNFFITCYPANLKNCTQVQKDDRDLNLNGSVDDIDLTILLRAFGSRIGD